MYCVSKGVQTDPSDYTIEEIILPDKDQEDGVQKTIAIEPPSVDKPFNELSTYDPNISAPNHNSFCIQHTSENPFKCQRCDRGFKTKVSLRRHKFREHGEGVPFECDQCDQLFVIKYELKRHKISRHTEGPFQCHLCQKTFTSKSYLKNHYKKHSHVQNHAECDKFLTLGHLNYHKERVNFWGGTKPSLEVKELSQRNLLAPEPVQYQLIYYQDSQHDTYSGDHNEQIFIKNEVLNHLEEADVFEKMEELNDNDFGFKISDGFHLPTEIELEDTYTTEMNPLDNPNFNQMEQLQSELPAEIELLEYDLPIEMNQFEDPNFKLELRNEMDELGNYQNESELPVEMEKLDFAIESNLPTEIDPLDKPNLPKTIDVDEKRDENLGVNSQISHKSGLIAKKLESQQRITRRDEGSLQIDLKDKGINADVGYKGDKKPGENLGTNLRISNKPGLIAKKCKKCNKWFTDLSRLRNHLKSSKCQPDINPNDSSKHTMSDKTVNSSQQTYHLLTNNCAKNLSCYSCERAFENPINLQKHREEVHTKVRSYKCKHCVSYFQSKRHLNVHVEQYCGWTKYHPNYGCQLCQVFFCDEITFQNHKKVHRNCFVRIKKLSRADKDPKIISINKRGVLKVVRKKRKCN